HRVHNTVWLTADVHYTAAHYYDPSQARFTEFLPFWEFVSGPLHASASPPSKIDDTFGPQMMFQKALATRDPILSPSAGFEFFGDVRLTQSPANSVSPCATWREKRYTRKLSRRSAVECDCSYHFSSW